MNHPKTSQDTCHKPISQYTFQNYFMGLLRQNHNCLLNKTGFSDSQSNYLYSPLCESVQPISSTSGNC